MPLPVIHNIRGLSSPPRRFLLFTGVNVISWHSIVGPALVLFARRIDMPPSWVGVLLSFMPLSMLLAPAAIPLVLRYGPKRMMLITWTSRNFVAAIAFAMPWALVWGGPRAGWYLLMAAILGFCIVRAIGAGAWLPWLHEVVPEHERGGYLSAETAVAQIIIVFINLFHALLLRGNPGLDRFMIVFAIGVTAGILSNLVMARVPGGQHIPREAMADGRRSVYANVLRDHVFMIFALIASLGFFFTCVLTSSYVLYMRDALGMSANTIMMVMTTGSFVVFLTIGYWARFADHSSPRAAIVLALAGHGAVALAFLGLTPGAPWTGAMLFPLVAMANVLFAAFNAIAHRAMLDCVPDHDRIGYTNVWVLGTSIALASAPIMAGAIIQAGGFHGFQICFAISGAGALACALAERFADLRRIEHEQPLAQLIGETQPVRTLARIIWITAGMHASNRDS